MEAAAHLLLSGGDELAVVTLAGAAEEIFGNLLRRANRPAMIDKIIELDRRVSGGREFNIVNFEVNGLRNALKHAKEPADDEVEVDENAHFSMVTRALVNYTLWGGELSPLLLQAYESISTALGRISEASSAE